MPAHLFSVRDRRALTAAMTAGLTHGQLDQLVAAHPLPGDPGHDAGKAGRVGLYVATVLAAADHGPLVEALAMIDPEASAPAARPALERLRRKAGLAGPPAPPPPPAPATVVVEPPALLDAPEGQDSAPEGEGAGASSPVVVLEQLDREHAGVQVIVHALVHAGVQVVDGGDGPVPAGALVLRSAGAG